MLVRHQKIQIRNLTEIQRKNKQNEPQKKSKYATFQKGKYELLKLIGQGMTSKVFMVRLASDHSKIFALKVITNEYWAKRKDYILNEVEVLK